MNNFISWFILKIKILFENSVDLLIENDCLFQQRKEMETITVEALNKLDGDLKGKYYSLETMKPEENKKLIDDHFMFKNDDP